MRGATNFGVRDKVVSSGPMKGASLATAGTEFTEERRRVDGRSNLLKAPEFFFDVNEHLEHHASSRPARPSQHKGRAKRRPGLLPTSQS